MVRTTVMLTKAQHIALAELAKTDPAGLKPAHLIRRFLSEGIARQKQAAK